MITDIKPFLPYYLGQTFWTPNSEGQINRTTLQYIMDMIDAGTKVRPILRRMNDMSEDERVEWNRRKQRKGYMYNIHADNTHWLISKGFDVFHLIPAGLAIDAATIKTESK